MTPHHNSPSPPPHPPRCAHTHTVPSMLPIEVGTYTCFGRGPYLHGKFPWCICLQISWPCLVPPRNSPTVNRPNGVAHTHPCPPPLVVGNCVMTMMTATTATSAWLHVIIHLHCTRSLQTSITMLHCKGTGRFSCLTIQSNIPTLDDVNTAYSIIDSTLIR